MQTELRSLGDLVEDAANTRTHDVDNLRAIRGSLLEFGQVEPLVVSSDTGVVIGGNGRLQVMRDLGWEQAECVVLDLPPERARALSIALNRTGELAGWDHARLAATLMELEAVDFDLERIGFTSAQLRELTSTVDADLADFHKPDLTTEVAPHERAVPDGSYFYVEFYGDDDLFEQLKVTLADDMRTGHEITPQAFVEMVRAYKAG